MRLTLKNSNKPSFAITNATPVNISLFHCISWEWITVHVKLILSTTWKIFNEMALSIPICNWKMKWNLSVELFIDSLAKSVKFSFILMQLIQKQRTTNSIESSHFYRTHISIYDIYSAYSVFSLDHLQKIIYFNFNNFDIVLSKFIWYFICICFNSIIFNIYGVQRFEAVVSVLRLKWKLKYFITNISISCFHRYLNR